MKNITMKNNFSRFNMAARTVLAILLLGIIGNAYAYDFSAVCETGQTLYYNITNAEDHYVELTPPNNSGSGYVLGNIILPTHVYDASMPLVFAADLLP